MSLPVRPTLLGSAEERLLAFFLVNPVEDLVANLVAHVRIINSIRVRQKDLAAFIEGTTPRGG